MGPDYDFEPRPSSYSVEEKLKVLLQREERRILANAVNNGQIIFTDEEAQTIENMVHIW